MEFFSYNSFMKNNTFGKVLKQLRLERKISQRKLGEELGVVNQTISSWEAGINEPSLDLLIQIAKYFNVNVSYLLGEEII